jgi:hypothetical protein
MQNLRLIIMLFFRFFFHFSQRIRHLRIRISILSKFQKNLSSSFLKCGGIRSLSQRYYPRICPMRLSEKRRQLFGHLTVEVNRLTIFFSGNRLIWQQQQQQRQHRVTLPQPANDRIVPRPKEKIKLISHK